MTKFIVEESLWDLFPEAAFGVVVAKDIKPIVDVAEEEAADGNEA